VQPVGINGYAAAGNRGSFRALFADGQAMSIRQPANQDTANAVDPVDQAHADRSRSRSSSIATCPTICSTRRTTVADSIDENDAKNALHVNPVDVPYLQTANIAVPIVPDPQMRRGCVRLDTIDGWIEDGPDVRLSRLKAMLDDMEGKL